MPISKERTALVALLLVAIGSQLFQKQFVTDFSSRRQALEAETNIIVHPTSTQSNAPASIPLTMEELEALIDARAEAKVKQESEALMKSVSGHGSPLNKSEVSVVPEMQQAAAASVLEQLFHSNITATNKTGDHTVQSIPLSLFLEEQAQHCFPGLSFDSLTRGRHAVLSNPSLVRDPWTEKILAGIRIIRGSHNYLMLCTLAHPLSESQCQDSGLNPHEVPASCSRRYYHDPIRKTPRFGMSFGPEDARLFFDQESGELGATFTIRACHRDTQFNETSPSYSMGTASWKRSKTTWKLTSGPTVLDVRQPDGSPDPKYQVMTKNWIPLPKSKSPNGDTAVNNLFLNAGWTQHMARNVIYKVTKFLPELATYEVQPIQKNLTVHSVDHKNYRGSTNFLPFRGFLLSLWHRDNHPQTGGGKRYYHYFHLQCPQPPFHTIATSDLFRMPLTNSNLQFAMGLLVDKEFVYLSWSASDKQSYISRYSHSNVWSRFVREKGYVNNTKTLDLYKSPSDLCPISVDEK